MATPMKSKAAVNPGTILIHKKWKETKLLKNIQAKFNSVSIRDIGEYDFCVAGDQFVSYIPESDLITHFDKERLKNMGETDTVFIAVRNTITAEQYSSLQDVLSISDDYKIIPVGNVLELPEILYQLSVADSDITPKKSPKSVQCIENLNLLLNIPGLGKLKAEKLIEIFGTIDRIATCSVNELSSVLGGNLATEVYKYFN